MAEYINRETVLEIVNKFDDRTALVFGRKIVNLPAADVAPVRHGWWVLRHKRVGGFRRYTGLDEMGEQHTIIVDERTEYDVLYCSECGGQSADNWLNYCPRCGAKMDGGQDDG